MLFNVEGDYGDRIIGYLVPDAFSDVARLRVSVNRSIVAVFSPPEIREALVQVGRHETGLCGFTIDETIVPGLAAVTDLELHDDETGCLVYRRRRPEMIMKKVLRLETHLFPLWRFDDSFSEVFQYFARGIDRHGRETTTQMLQLVYVDSLYASGRIQFKNFAYFIENGFDCCVIVHEPHQEFVERLLVLRQIRAVGSLYLGERDATRLQPAIEFAEKLPLDDPRAMHRALLDIPDDVAAMLSNPVVRQLTTANPDEMPNNAAIAGALDVLSTFTVVGMRDRADDFVQALGEWFGLDPNALPALPVVGAAAELTESIRESKVIDILLEKDIELYHHLVSARAGFDDSLGSAPPVIDGSAHVLT